MSDVPRGDGWWQASDGRYYPPDQHPQNSGSLQEAPHATSTGRGDPPASAGSDGPRSRSALVVGTVGAVLVAAVAVLAVTQLGGDGGDAAGDADVLLEPISSPGPNAFTASVAPEPSAELAAFAHDRSGPSAGESVRGDTPGLYGGTRDDASCDARELARFLVANAALGAAWASVVDIDPDDIPAYVAGLTPVNLTADTRVTNHGYDAGEAIPRQAVLERGTAVLVDDRGVPRVRCSCGNPLVEPTITEGESHEGEPWDGFGTESVVVIVPSVEPIVELELVDVATGDTFSRPTGTRGDADYGPADSPADGPGDRPDVGSEPAAPPADDPAAGPDDGHGPDDLADGDAALPPGAGAGSPGRGVLELDGRVYEFDVVDCRLDPGEPGMSFDLGGESDELLAVRVVLGWDEGFDHFGNVEAYPADAEGSWTLFDDGATFELDGDRRQHVGDSTFAYLADERRVVVTGQFERLRHDTAAGQGEVAHGLLDATCP